MNSMIKERLELAKERITEIKNESNVGSFSGFFEKTAAFLVLLMKQRELVESGELFRWELLQLQENNHALYGDILPEHYGTSFGNPEYCAQVFGEVYGNILCFLYGELRAMIPYTYEGRDEDLLKGLELFLEIYGSFRCSFEETEETRKQEGLFDLPKPEHLKESLYYYISDYTREAYYTKIRNMLDVHADFARKIIEKADLSDVRYLYYFGEYISENELKTAAYLNTLPEEMIAKMADTYTEGYRIGFEAGNKDITKKKIVNIRYSLGFERMIRRAVQNFRKIGLEATIYRATTSVLEGRGMSRIGYYGGIPNKQYDFDHKDDQALILDKALLQVRLEALREAYEEYKEQAGTFGGPAVVEVFGERSVELVSQKQALHLSKEQQQMLVEYAASAGELQNNYIHGEVRSFTIIAFPVPEIASGQEDGKEGKDRYPEIFDAVIRINTLDYQLYQRIQQKIIDVLDRGKYVMVKGMNGNRTNMKVMLHTLQNPDRETNFENCVADVNIPVGEVFTSPVLTGTEGTLHVSHVYLDELEYKDLILRFEDGRVTDYSCANFTAEEENRKLIKDNILFHHETLPIGEFAIGTNTTAFVAARKYHIEDKLPILIAEKTGPHFAVGDTCYSHSEEVRLFNPDGKEIIAKDNECSIKRKEDSHKAYFNCHTDITIPYDELGEVSVVTMTEEVIPIIEEGRFVLAGCEELNAPFDQESMD